ncbi:MAG: acyl-CoA thioesterase [Bacteroidetes bacterium]|nr:acyl-CoA thioesterase [Bacteroidota bacterium]MCH8170181.1 acyl-CoA thioesterase [Bacteroidota bacterium]MCH8941275.1 acyl-CoA thioesterase [Bacteroidota bacterium]
MDDLSLFKHKIQMNIRFSDLDAMGHVNNAKYLTYLEEARINYFNNILYLSKENLDYQAVIAKVEINYFNQIKLRDKLEIYTRIFKLGKKSFDFEILIVINNNNGKIIASSSVTKMVGFNYKTQQTVTLPDYFRKAVRNYEKEVENNPA